MYKDAKELNPGDELTPTQVKDLPTLSWNADPAGLYTIALVGK